MSKNKKFFLGNQEYSILNEIISETGIMLISFLLSGRSIKRMREVEKSLRYKKDSKKRTLKKLEEKKYIKIDSGKILITKLGEKIFEQNKLIKLNYNKSLKKEKWDKKWRMISFDIPNEIQEIRDLLRNVLLKSGFLQIQKSVYIYPYEIKELLKFLQKNKEFKKYIIYSEIIYSTSEKIWMEDFKKIINKSKHTNKGTEQQTI